MSVPACDLAVYMHQQRPLRSGPSLSLIYDTIALRYTTKASVRLLKRHFLRRVASTSSVLVTLSAYSRDCIIRDLKVAADRVKVVDVPFDDEQADRVLGMRKQLRCERTALYVGNFLPHKNVVRLITAFARSAFRRSGGRLALVGGTRQELGGQSVEFGQDVWDSIDLVGRCDQVGLDRLMASSLFLIQPSLEEGFGLPAWEAMCCGLPLCVSDGGSLPEITRGRIEPFCATSISAMTAAIDATAERAAESSTEAARLSEELRGSSPTVVEFAQNFAHLVTGVLRSS